MLVLHRAKLLASNQSVLALGVAPSGVSAAAPHSAPARMPGVYAQGLCTMQSQPSIHSPSPRGRGLGFRQGCRDRTPKGFAGRKAHKAYTALHRGEGVWGFGKDAEIERPKALQDAKPTKRSYRDREFPLFL